MSTFESWGRYPKVNQQGEFLQHRKQALPELDDFLPFGLGRSYGDSCLNSQHHVLSSAQLNHFIAFDKDQGVIRAEAGCTLAEIIELVLPFGWFLPVTPGTKFVTLGGAVANDVHGKNHHKTASFGNHVLSFELLRSDGSRLVCSEQNNSEYFHASIGGLGLTGFITEVTLQLKAVTSQFIDSESIKYNRLQDFFTLSEDSAENYEYTVAWLDCSASGKQLGRGHFIRGNHAKLHDLTGKLLALSGKKKTMPELPISLINPLSVGVFNQLYYQRQQASKKTSLESIDPFFYPLDGINDWNRMYGKRGFVQYQCVVPNTDAEKAIAELLQIISKSRQGSFLVVLKIMGDIASKGLLSFSAPGATLAIDFPFKGEKTVALLKQLDRVVEQAGGKIYPAKDARMPAALFQKTYPQWTQLEQLRDPKINSDFWRRVTQQENTL